MSGAHKLLHGVIKGAPTTVRQHIRRATQMQKLIEGRFKVKRITKWHAKHAKWVLQHGLGDIKESTRHDYYKTIRVIAKRLGRWEGWEPFVRGPWTRPGNTTKY